MLGIVPSGLGCNAAGCASEETFVGGGQGPEVSPGHGSMLLTVPSLGTHETPALSCGSPCNQGLQDTLHCQSCDGVGSFTGLAQTKFRTVQCTATPAANCHVIPGNSTTPFMLAAGIAHGIPLMDARPPPYMHASMGMIDSTVAPPDFSAPSPRCSLNSFELARLSSVSCPLSAYEGPGFQPSPTATLAAMPAAAVDMQLEVAALLEVIPPLFDSHPSIAAPDVLLSSGGSSAFNNGFQPKPLDAAITGAPAPGGWANLHNLLPVLQGMPSVDEFCLMMEAEDEAARSSWLPPQTQTYSM